MYLKIFFKRAKKDKVKFLKAQAKKLEVIKKVKRKSTI